MSQCSGTLSSTSPCLISCSQSGTPCNSSLFDSSSSSFLFRFSISADSLDGFPRAKSLVLSLLLVAGIFVVVSLLRWRCWRNKWRWSRGTRRQTKDNEWYIVRCVAIDFLAIFDEMWFFDRWSSGKCTHDPRRASREKELRDFLQETSLSRTNPILWHIPWLLLLFAPRRSLSPPSLGFSISSRFLIRLC